MAEWMQVMLSAVIFAVAVFLMNKLFKKLDDDEVRKNNDASARLLSALDYVGKYKCLTCGAYFSELDTDYKPHCPPVKHD